MAGSQQLPSWMTLSTIVITNSKGQPVSTGTTTLELPLTYYGPSIPLGTDGAWTWGGLTPPASSTPTSLTATPTSTPSTLTPPPSTSFTSSTFSTSSTRASISTTPTVSATPIPFSSLSTGAIIGIIFGSIVGFNLLLFLLLCFLRYRARRDRNPRHPTPIWTHWQVVSPSAPPADEQRPAGVGSPRDSGEEADSFLQRSRGASGHTGASIRPVASLPAGAAPPQIVGSTGSGDSGHTSSSAVTDYGVLMPGGGPIGQAFRDGAHSPARASSEMVGHIMPPGELLKIEDEEEEPLSPPRMYGIQRPSDPMFPEVFAPLLPPPPLDVDRLSTRKPSSLNEKEKSVRSLSYPASDMEDPKVYTARRVKVKELGPRSPTDETSDLLTDDGPIAGPSGWRDSFGLGSLSRLRRSWFGGSSSRDTSKSSGGRARADEAEVNRSLLGAPPRSRSRVGLGLTIDGERPMSSVSTKSAVSGNTVYHDAVSRLGTPVPVPSRAMTPASAHGPAASNGVPPALPTVAPPAYAVNDPYDSMGSRGSFPHSQGVDVLDLPVPQPASAFAASGGTSTATRSVAIPPGLGDSQIRAWRDSLSVITGSSNNASIMIDVLDADPPTAGEGWRSMAASLGIGMDESGPNPGERRATSGTPQVVHQTHPTHSDQGSLHSMHSLLSPRSRSPGPVPVSSRHSHVYLGSNSSRPSAHSRVQTASSGSVHSGSLSSSGRRQGSAVSPSVSAFGGMVESGRLSPLDELPLPTSGEPNRVSVLGPVPSFSRSMTAPTIRSVGATTTSGDTDITRMTTTLTAGTEATSLNKDGKEDELSEFRLGMFDFERVRI